MPTAAEDPDFLFIGHRGYAAKYPENTLVGFRAALRANLKMVELDVRLSRDRRLMVIHDADLSRVAGIPQRVDELTCAELQALDVGTWFDPAFAHEGVPTLDAVFARLAGGMRINVEIKADEFETADPPDGIERQVMGVIHRFQAHQRTLISSFSPAVLRRIRRLSATQSLAVLSDAGRQPDGLALCREVGAAAWNPHHSLVTPQGIAAAHAAGLKVYPFTLNGAADFHRVQAAGVDGVFSDDPGGLMSLSCSKTE
jgi:glycerophosphoryl diester phosphodiesterase